MQNFVKYPQRANEKVGTPSIKLNLYSAHLLHIYISVFSNHKDMEAGEFS